MRGGRYYRDGRWYHGYPRWRGNERWYGGYRWRSAYDGWYYWNDNAWLWAPAFGVAIAAAVPYYDGYGYDGYNDSAAVVVVSYKPWSDGWYSWCGTRYRSFDPATGYWAGYDGIHRFCVYR